MLCSMRVHTSGVYFRGSFSVHLLAKFSAAVAQRAVGLACFSVGAGALKEPKLGE